MFVSGVMHWLRQGSERGSAVVEFVLVSAVLIPVFMSIMSIGLFLHVRNTMSMCAHEGARAGASWNNHHSEAVVSAKECISEALGPSWGEGATSNVSNGLIVVTMRGHFTPYGWMQALWDPTISVQGRAVNEPGNP